MAIENNPAHHEFLATLRNQGATKEQISAAAAQLQGGASLKDVQTSMGINPSSTPAPRTRAESNLLGMAPAAVDAAVKAKIAAIPKDQMPSDATKLGALYAETRESVLEEARVNAAKAAATSPDAMSAHEQQLRAAAAKPAETTAKPDVDMHTTITTDSQGNPVSGSNKVVYKDGAGNVLGEATLQDAVKRGDAQYQVGKDGAASVGPKAEAAEAAAQKAADKAGIFATIKNLFVGDNKMSKGNMATAGLGAAATLHGAAGIVQTNEEGKKKISFSRVVETGLGLVTIAATIAGHRAQGNAMDGLKAIGKHTGAILSQRGNNNSPATPTR